MQNKNCMDAKVRPAGMYEFSYKLTGTRTRAIYKSLVLCCVIITLIPNPHETVERKVIAACD